MQITGKRHQIFSYIFMTNTRNILFVNKTIALFAAAAIDKTYPQP